MPQTSGWKLETSLSSRTMWLDATLQRGTGNLFLKSSTGTPQTLLYLAQVWE